LALAIRWHARFTSQADKFILVVNYKGKAQSFPIEITLKQKYKLGLKTFDDLLEVIWYLSENSLKMKDGMALKLGSPAPGGQMLVIPGKDPANPLDGVRCLCQLFFDRLLHSLPFTYIYICVCVL